MNKTAPFYDVAHRAPIAEILEITTKYMVVGIILSSALQRISPPLCLTTFLASLLVTY